jgi:thymidylate synthase (FAD)
VKQNTIKCLDHGFVKLLNLSGPVRRLTTEGKVTVKEIDGQKALVREEEFRPFDADDTDPAITARISFNNFDEQRSKELDLKLVEYLIKNRHSTPIEMIEIWLEMKLPIFIARQFIRHRTATVNEVSARYSVLPEEWYIPEVVGGKPTNGMKQGQENSLDENCQKEFKYYLDKQCTESYKLYQTALKNGVAPEHARLFLPLNIYTHWVWKQDLHNMMHFLALRLDSHAQIEARVYAQAIYDLLSKYLPETMKLFDKYKRL